MMSQSIVSRAVHSFPVKNNEIIQFLFNRIPVSMGFKMYVQNVVLLQNGSYVIMLQ